MTAGERITVAVLLCGWSVVPFMCGRDIERERTRTEIDELRHVNVVCPFNGTQITNDLVYRGPHLCWPDGGAFTVPAASP